MQLGGKQRTTQTLILSGGGCRRRVADCGAPAWISSGGDWPARGDDGDGDERHGDGAGGGRTYVAHARPILCRRVLPTNPACWRVSLAQRLG